MGIDKNIPREVKKVIVATSVLGLNLRYPDGDTWGSVQYTSAEFTFEFLCDLRKKMSFQEVLELLGVDWKIQTKDVSKELSKLVKKEIKDYKSFFKTSTTPYDKVKTVDEYFEACRSASDDLWTCSKKAFQALVTLKGKTKRELIDNSFCGVRCWLLWELGLVKKKTSYVGFDT